MSIRFGAARDELLECDKEGVARTRARRFNEFCVRTRVGRVPTRSAQNGVPIVRYRWPQVEQVRRLDRSRGGELNSVQ